MQNQDVFMRKKLKHTLILLTMVAIFWGASTLSNFNLVDGITSLPKAILWMSTNLIPDAKAFERLPKILERLSETVLLSISVTVIAGILAFAFSLLGSRTTKTNRLLSKTVRMIAAFFRNVPDVVWAMLFLFSFGQNMATGFLALFFTTFGLLTRAFIETIDEVSSDCVEALEATGASFVQIVFQGIIPSAIAGIITWVLYMIETNIRSSTLIGILTATGIGYLFDLYYKRLDFGSASLIVIAIVIVVIAIETISNKIRRVIM
ncbi:PhnE/PtxC family ABC transporter permease [Anaerotignum sp.]|uniref:PhnE/PtxC family ABC transporter permease n=1 Tax=Anaerotignum sp. TaxID=2039241 RepID=UPI0028AE0F14|nr:ABC transporter permease subunit [Anaerotignum sp.]